MEDLIMNNQLRKFGARDGFLPAIFRLGDDMFTNFFENSNIPAANIKESKKDFKVELAVPGFEKDDFNIVVDKDILTISVNKETKHEEKDENEKILRQEFSSTSFSRSFTLPENIDTENISAEQKKGVLSIVLPKKDMTKEESVKRIEIK